MREYIDDIEGEVEGVVPVQPPPDLKPILTCIRSIPCSSSECERGFSLMNLIVTNLRTSLLITNIANLMFLNVNGPPLSRFDATSFVKTWKLQHRLAGDVQSRKCQSKLVDQTRRQLWDVCNK